MSHRTSIPSNHYSAIIVLNNDNEGTIFALDFTMDFVLCAIIAVLVMVTALIVKLLWNINGGDGGAAGGRNTSSATESSLLLSPSSSSSEEGTLFSSSYGTMIGSSEEEDLLESGKLGFCRSSSGELYDAKICVICFDHQRNCFFVPCGHCISCIHCAKRIMSGEIKSCPICRTFINKVAKMRLCESNAL